jgi:integrase
VRVARPLREVEGRLERAAEPKTLAGERLVPLPKLVADLLAAELPPNGGPLDPVFVGAHGGLYRRTAWRERVWVSALGRATDAKGNLLWPRPWPPDHKGHQTVPVRVHDLRHTWASWLEDAGIPRAAIEELLGHSRRGVTERYIHTFPEVLVRAARAIDERLAPAARALRLAA